MQCRGRAYLGRIAGTDAMSPSSDSFQHPFLLSLSRQPFLSHSALCGQYQAVKKTEKKTTLNKMHIIFSLFVSMPSFYILLSQNLPLFFPSTFCNLKKKLHFSFASPPRPPSQRISPALQCRQGFKEKMMLQLSFFLSCMFADSHSHTHAITRVNKVHSCQSWRLRTVHKGGGAESG